MQIVFIVLMLVLGCAFGSFFCCQARRSKDVHILSRAASGRPVATGGRRSSSRCRAPEALRKDIEHPRSICLHCHKQLKWYDNIPVVSWILLRGRCRFCHKKIGVAEIIAEVSSGVALALIATTINVEAADASAWVRFVLVTIFTLILIYLAIYDGLYGELPSVILTISVICAIITLIPQMWTGFLIGPFLSGLLYGGIYLLLYIVSKGKWVGDGDWILALSIGLVLGSPWLSIVALFVANFSACLVMFPFLKKIKNHQIYFGPFLALSFVVVYAMADVLNQLLSTVAISAGAL